MSRFPESSASKKSTMPGPGSYHPKLPQEVHRKHQARGALPMQPSPSDGRRQFDSTLVPHPAYVSSAHLSTGSVEKSARLLFFKSKRPSVCSSQAPTDCFGSKEARFGGGQRGIFSGAMQTPGPGQYDSSIEMNDPMIKRSFNITIG